MPTYNIWNMYGQGMSVSICVYDILFINTLCIQDGRDIGVDV